MSRGLVRAAGLLLPLLALAACQSCPSTAVADPRVAGQYLVTLAPEADPQAVLERAFADLGLEAVERLEVAGAVYRIRLDRDPGPEAVRERAGAVPGIRRVQPEYRYSVPEPSPDGDGPARPGRRIR